MCWSLEVSAVFATLEFLAICRLSYRLFYKHEGHWFEKAVLPTLVTVFWVEFMEVFVWADVAPLADKLSGSPTCGAQNRTALVLLVHSLYAQPLAFNWACYVGCYPYLKRKYKTLCWIAVVSFVSLSLGRIVAEVASSEFSSTGDTSIWTPTEQQIYRLLQIDETSGSGLVTCAYKGRSGHLHWQFAVPPLDAFLPNHWVYFWIGYFVPIVWMRPWVPFGVYFLLGAASLLLNLLATQSAEAFSVWCWTGIWLHASAVAAPWLSDWAGKQPERSWVRDMAKQGVFTPHRNWKGVSRRPTGELESYDPVRFASRVNMAPAVHEKQQRAAGTEPTEHGVAAGTGEDMALSGSTELTRRTQIPADEGPETTTQPSTTVSKGHTDTHLSPDVAAVAAANGDGSRIDMHRGSIDQPQGWPERV